MTCGHCRIDLDTPSEDGCCWNCGHALTPGNFSSIIEEKFVPAAIDQTLPISVYTQLNIRLLVGNREVFPLKITNLSSLHFTHISLTATIWGELQPLQRDIPQNLRPYGETIVGLPIEPQHPGRILFTSLVISLRQNNGEILQYRASEEIIVAVALENSSAQINQVTLQGYAQLLGHVIMDGESNSWNPLAIEPQTMEKQVAIPSFPPHPAPVDYCHLTIKTAHKCRYIYLCSRPQVWLGRSKNVEFQTLPSQTQEYRKISARQCKISHEGDCWSLIDIGSANEPE